MDNEERQRRARAMLNDDLFKEAVEEVRSRAIERFAKSPVDDDEERREARMMLAAMQQAQSVLERWAEPTTSRSRHRGREHD